MSLQAFLEPASLLQTMVLALSIFNLTTFLWLAFTVWLNGDRRAGIVRLGVVGLGFSALFFFIHSILISSPLASSSSSFLSLDFWWSMIWVPAVAVPYIWFAIGLHYATLINAQWQRPRALLLVLSGLLALVILLLLIFNRNSFTYMDALDLLVSSNSSVNRSLFSPLMLIPPLFLLYVTFCALGPWFTPGRISRLLKLLWRFLRGGPGRLMSGYRPSLRRKVMEAFWNDPTDVDMLEEPLLSWHLARPGLLLAALLMVGLTTTLGVLVVQLMLNLLRYGAHVSVAVHQALLSPDAPVPFNLLTLDLVANGAVALVILLIGYSIVRHGVLIERPLARRGFFEQWRGIVIVATLLATLIALLVALTHSSSLGGLLLITCLATGVYALFTWSSYTAHDRYVALLGPFVRSTGQRHWLNTDLQKTEQELEHLFFLLCHDVLAVQCAYLSVVAGTVRRSFRYCWPADLAPGPQWHKSQKLLGSEPQNARASRARREGVPYLALASRIQIYVKDVPMVVWILPVYNERGLVATLYLGPREDGGILTDEDMNLAHACGQRILDTLGDHEAMQAVASLLRRRVIDVKLLGAQQRRVLHDEILPQMHLALLQLEMVRSSPDQHQTGLSEGTSGLSVNEQGVSPEARRGIVDEAITTISAAHRRLAAMMRATAPGAPLRLEHDGLINAIQTMLEQDFQHAFDEVEWCVDEEIAIHIDEVISPALAELIFAAVQEALRNAARHARGTDVHRSLHLLCKATWDQRRSNFEMIISDDGVGISEAGSTTGTGGGLLTHSALLAIAGGSLTIQSTPGEGVTVRIQVPIEVLQL